MVGKLSITALPMQGRRVLIRVDFNVPVDKNANITDDIRIVATLPSIRYVLDKGGSVILMSHFGRPKGQEVPELSLGIVAARLSELLGLEVIMAPDCVGAEVDALAKQLQPGQVMLLENLRFYGAEEHPDEDPSFAGQLASLGDCYVNDAFGTAHRIHSSTATIASFFPGEAAAGLLMEKEIEFLGSAILEPKRPFYAIIGGAKVSTKMGVINSLVDKVDGLLIGGGMMFTFAKALGQEIGNSIHEDEFLDTARQVVERCQTTGVSLWLPKDVVVADAVSNEATMQVVTMEEGVPDGYQGLDIGPATTEEFSKVLQNAATVLWNGPLGVFELSNFAAGTKEVARTLASLSAVTVVGGGDSLAAVSAVGVADKISHLSTGGGACLEYLEFGRLPGIDALTDLSASSAATVE